MVKDAVKPAKELSQALRFLAGSSRSKRCFKYF
jgi:hypothetical protein